MIENIGKIKALYSQLSVGDEDRDDGESNSIVNRNNIRFIVINKGIDSKAQNTLEFAPY